MSTPGRLCLIRIFRFEEERTTMLFPVEELQEIYQEQISRYEKRAAKLDKIMQAVFDEDE